MTSSVEKFPVFEYQPRDERSIEKCLGWVTDAEEACKLLLAESCIVKHTDGAYIPCIGTSVFGGVQKGQIRVSTEDGPCKDGAGFYRWQECFWPFFDTAENAGMPTPLDNVYIYKR